MFDIHNSLRVTVYHCLFIDNRGSGIVHEPYRGNTGGLSITYNNIDPVAATSPFVNVSECNFTNNSAAPAPDSLRTSDQTFGVGILTGRGGGMAVFVREDVFNVSALISNCYFSHNNARSYGGGMYILLDGKGSHMAFVEDNLFKSNTAVMGGGAIILVGKRIVKNAPHSFMVKGCEFKENSSPVGGGLYYSINLGERASNIIHIENCSFIRNFLTQGDVSFGAAMSVDVAEDFEQKTRFHVNTIKDW